MTENVQDNREKRRFEMPVGDEIVFADYRREGDTLFLTYVESPPGLRGTGAAGRLMEGIVGIAEKEKAKIVPICSYAVSWMRRHPDHRDLLKSDH